MDLARVGSGGIAHQAAASSVLTLWEVNTAQEHPPAWQANRTSRQLITSQQYLVGSTILAQDGLELAHRQAQVHAAAGALQSTAQLAISRQVKKQQTRQISVWATAGKGSHAGRAVETHGQSNAGGMLGRRSVHMRRCRSGLLCFIKSFPSDVHVCKHTRQVTLRVQRNMLYC